MGVGEALLETIRRVALVPYAHATARLEILRKIVAAHPVTRQAARVHKFNASRARYGDTVYHSKKEANYAARLDMLKKAADPKERVAYWTRQIRVPLVVKSILIANWYIDFLVHFADGREEYHEVKGFATETYRLKRKLFGALYPNRVLKVIR